MFRNAMTISEMGEKACWMIVQQAMGMKDAKSLSDFMSGRVAVLLFTRASLPERLCATAAVRQMGGSTIYQGIDGGKWREDVSSFQSHLFPILGYFLDCLYCYGYPASVVNDQQEADFPVINAGGPDSHPAHALADISCMLRVVKKLDGLQAAWVGCANGTLHSLMEATVWFPFNIVASLPPDNDSTHLQNEARKIGAKIKFVKSPEEAVIDKKFIFAGRKPEIETPQNLAWSITPELLAKADPHARLLLSATPTRAIPISPQIFSGKHAMLVRQAQYRLCVHKRILHWVFGEID